jgi:hypothetical protein
MPKPRDPEAPIISPGNAKLGKIPNISTVPGRSCPGARAAGCMAECYAMKAFRQYPSTRAAWTHNHDLWTRNPGAYFGGIVAYLQRKKPARFRWHVAGDIQSPAYLAGMIGVARECPATRFLAFTKTPGLDLADLPPNLAILASRWTTDKGSPSPGAPEAWAGDDPRMPADVQTCPGSCSTCDRCWAAQPVRFALH